MATTFAAAHCKDLDATLEEAWRLLSEGAVKAASPYHIINVATAAADGTPRIRSVVLRDFDKATRRLRFHTDVRSGKAAEIAAAENIAVHVYAKDEKIQLRMVCRATIHHDDEVAREAWRATKMMSRECYSQHEGPGTVVAAPESVAFEDSENLEGAYVNFAAVLA
ncbi:MAG: pyridoxamine 5'-phosphate oxidase family protein, partial [Methyloceanibacter sp.]|nr:pyridoxamine 5'-phosphate oxidase family protein [Methyloceanibacter sp.]